MNTATPDVREFFDQYARSRSALDIDAIASQYADSFMVAGPKGARVTEKSAVLAAFPKGQEGHLLGRNQISRALRPGASSVPLAF
jgi:hypothetical protein